MQRFDALTLGGVGGADGVPRYAFYGNGAADRLLTADALPVLDAAVRDPSRLLRHRGQPVASALEALVRREADRRLIAYDPNIRLNVEPTVSAGRNKVETLAGLAHFVKISDEDAHLLYAGTADGALAERWLAAGARLVVMTRSGAGASAWNRGTGWTSPPRR